MLAVVASRLDENARNLAARWKFQRAALLTCEDLSTPGWRHHLNDPASSTAVISGQVVPVKEITGVLTRRPALLEEEFVHIAPSDRKYVAAEMNAFLVSWLASLTCPILNPPTAACLSGPNWRTEQWIHAAAQCGIPVVPQHIHIPPDKQTPESFGKVTEVTIVGDRCLGEVEKTLATYARSLARRADVQLLSLKFGETRRDVRLIGVNLFPEITPELADAILEYFQTEAPQ